MDIKQLEIVAKVAELRSFSKAAESLNISQPTVSMHIQNLERELKAKLFDRLGKKVIPTPEGKLLYRYALDIIGKRNEALRELTSFNKTFKTTVRILASNIPGEYLIPWVIQRTEKLIPNALMDVEILDTKKVIGLLEREIPDYDIGFVGGKVAKPKLEYKGIIEDELILIAPSYYKKNDIDIETFKELPLIFRESDSGTRISTEKALKTYKIDISKINIVAYL
ncbi:MAG: LysR family transcriptional regulator, partial [Nitrospiraceae bacterium]|nr:LysR family transcriptional regulator [Nitrospiraceae bacterium]